MKYYSYYKYKGYSKSYSKREVKFLKKNSGKV